MTRTTDNLRGSFHDSQCDCPSNDDVKDQKQGALIDDEEGALVFRPRLRLIPE